MRSVRFRVLALAALLPLALARAADSPAPVLDALVAGERLTLDFAALSARAALAEGEDFKAIELGRDAHTSHHVVAIRHTEVPHRHDRHDLFVVIVRGHGDMRLGDQKRAVGEGSALYVPRGTVHAFRNAAAKPAIAYAVYAPAFDGTDRVDVE